MKAPGAAPSGRHVRPVARSDQAQPGQGSSQQLENSPSHHIARPVRPAWPCTPVRGQTASESADRTACSRRSPPAGTALAGTITESLALLPAGTHARLPVRRGRHGGCVLLLTVLWQCVVRPAVLYAQTCARVRSEELEIRIVIFYRRVRPRTSDSARRLRASAALHLCLPPSMIARAQERRSSRGARFA